MSKDNPLYFIFIKTPEGNLTEEINSVKNIQFFFKFLQNDLINSDLKEEVLKKLTNIIENNRYVSEFFSSYEQKSIYIYLFDLYTNKNTTQKVRDAIISLLEQLRINIQTGKEVYEYLFQKLSKIYRNEITPTSDNVYQYLNLLNVILGETIASRPPKNYLACSGHCNFHVDLNKKSIKVGCSFTVNLNFKISKYYPNEKNPDKNRISNLVKFRFSSGKTLSINLQYPVSLIVEVAKKDLIKILPDDEWINLLLTIFNANNGLYLFYYVNGENHPTPYKLEKLQLKYDDTINYIDFFNDFYGEVTSIFMLSQEEEGKPNVNNSAFLSQLKNYKEGLWKKKKYSAFFETLLKYESVNEDLKMSKSFYIRSSQIKAIENKRPKTLYENLVFVFTPMNYSDSHRGFIEDIFGRHQLEFKGDIRRHQYHCYQKQLMLVSGFNNFLPIAEMFLIYPETLNEQNLELFLNTINTLFNFRKENIKRAKQDKFFKILSMFMEKYPNKLYTETILNAFFSLGKTLFVNDSESVCSIYFNYILLNEKILSKYNENLQIVFWNQLFKFCESDKDQIGTFVNINRLCLILRFYDKNKYKEMCCQEHLDMIKDEYIGSKKVMNPTMTKKLSYLRDIMLLIIDSQEPGNALSLFKLLTLDLSPCLIKFILNIFMNVFEKNEDKDKWRENFIDQLIKAKYDVIVINTFIHTLPDVRYELLRFVYLVHLRMISTKYKSNFSNFEKMIKTCLLPKEMFYRKRLIGKKPEKNLKNITDNKIQELQKDKVNIKKEETKKEKPEINEPKKEDSKIETPKKEELKKETPKKEEPKKEEPKKEEEKKEEIKKEETKKEGIIKLETKDEESKKEDLKFSRIGVDFKKRISVAECNPLMESEKKEDKTKPIKTGSDRKNFLSILSKFDKPKNTPNKQEIKKPLPKQIKKDNEFFKTLNTPPSAIKTSEELKKSMNQNNKEEKKEKQKEEKLNEDKSKEEELKEEKTKEEIPTNETKEKPIEEKPEEEEKLKEEEKPKEEESKEGSIKEETKNKKEELKEIISIDDKKNDEKIENVIINDTIETEEKNEQESTTQKPEEDTIQTLTHNDEIDKKSDEENNINDNDDNIYDLKEGEKEIILKDSIYDKYINRLYSIFILWSLAMDVSMELEWINLEGNRIRNLNTIEILFVLNNQLKDKKFTINFLNYLVKLTKYIDNCFSLFTNKKVYSSILDVTLENYKLKGKEEEKCLDLGKTILVNSFINSFECCEKHKYVNYPGKEIDVIFIWGNKIIEENIIKKDLLFDFIGQLLLEFLNGFKSKYEQKLILDTKEINLVFEKNNYFKNYFYYMNEMFNFSFRYALDKEIIINGIERLYSSSSDMFKIFAKSMRIDESISNNISQSWFDFPLINDILYRIKNIWNKKNVFKNLKLDKYKKNKVGKYNYIIEQKIIDKSNKNIFIKELLFLCYEETKEQIEPLINIVPLTYISIIYQLKNAKENKDFKYWLKELKYFIRFIIIASSNLTKINQLEIYNSIQEKCLVVIAAGLSFLYSLHLMDTTCKEKIEKNFISLLLLCLKIVRYQIDYKLKHINIFKLAKKPARNDLQDCAVCLLFNDYIKDKMGNPLINQNTYDKYPLENNNYHSTICSLIKNNEFLNAFVKNENLKKKLDESIYSLTSYEKIVNNRYKEIKSLEDIYDNSYKKTILTLLPQYETELAKYSNNSLEKNIKNKNRYKNFKKSAFSWRGYWSCRENFFENISEFKYKLINHYTKSFMKPILVPIIDISYYLPEFSAFNPKNLFKDENNNKGNKFKLNLDIDKILKTNDQNVQDTTNSTTKEKEDNNEENYLLSIYKSNPVLYEKLLNIANNLEFGKEEEFSYVERESSDTQKKNKNEEKKKKKYFLSCLVKTSHHIKGVCFIDDKKLNFKVFLNQKTGNAMSGVEIGFTNKDDDYDQERKTCFGSYFVCHPKDKDLYKISINYKDIKWIFKRKYYYKNSALEIYTTTNKTYYFNFKYENDRKIVLGEILKKLENHIPIVDDLKESNEAIGYENCFLQKKDEKAKKKLSKIVKLWKNWEITTFEFLMWLNIFGNRSYNDITQYPVFPWILSNYEDPLQVEVLEQQKRSATVVAPGGLEFLLNATFRSASIMMPDVEKTEFDYQYRDMSLPMGMLELSDEGSKRKEEFELNYETLLELGDEGEEKPYVFGSNYSNPIYVCNFLMRLFPFTHISIELQGQGFDKPDRLFLSVKNAFYNSASQKGDVRELIPEFFYLPEIFRNINKLNMGKLENGIEVNDVMTPCENDPYIFIMTMKSVLENNQISYTIQNWIDLIFGYKARGKNAEIAKNIFKEASYQENIDINKSKEKESTLRAVEFGLIPTQCMIKECSKRERKELIKRGKEISNPSCDLHNYRCLLREREDNEKIKKNNQTNKKIEGTVLKFASFAPEKVLILLGGEHIVEKRIVYSTFDKSYIYETSNYNELTDYRSKMSEFYNPKSPNSKVIQFCHKGKTLILGGFFDGKVCIVSLEQKNLYKNEIPFVDKKPVIAIAVDQNDEFCFLGNCIGNIRVMKIDNNPKKWESCQIIADHLSAISDINCNSELNLWVSASVDGYINLYTLPLCKLLRCIKIQSSRCNYVFLSSSPLPSIIAIAEKSVSSEIFVYSINGKLITNQEEPSIITCPIIIKDLNSNEYLAYIINESIIIRSIPTLIRQSAIDNISDIYSIFPSEDMKLLYGVNKSGEILSVIKDI